MRMFKPVTSFSALGIQDVRLVETEVSVFGKLRSQITSVIPHTQRTKGFQVKVSGKVFHRLKHALRNGYRHFSTGVSTVTKGEVLCTVAKGKVFYTVGPHTS